jgi:molecular chaperone GrpE
LTDTVTDDTESFFSDNDPRAASPEMTELAAERDDLKDRLLRMTAEFDNYRKRVERERRELSEAASADLIRDILPIIDDLERAMAAAGDAAADAALVSGVELTHRPLLEQLRRRGVEPVESIGQIFNPEVHEAVGSVPADGRPDGEIVAVFRKGYRAGGRLLRPAMVQVAKA